ncbi:Na+/H+ antiporter NhaC family protein [candidate division KSB1 bacterium]
MNIAADYKILSLLPILTALILSFITKDAVFSLLIGCIIGVIICGLDPATGLSQLFTQSLGNSDFMWVMMIEIAIGILIAFYMRAGVISALTEWASDKIRKRRTVSGFGWLMGLFVFFSDYFSPLFAGPIIKPLTDKHKISREMLAYLLDSGSSPVCTIIPLSAWAVYIAGLLKGYGPIATVEDGMNVFLNSIPYNFYGWFAVIFAGFIGYQLIPNFGPMKKAELRAEKEGKVIRPGSTPLTGEEFDFIKPLEGKKTNLIIYLTIPALIIICTAVGTFIIDKNAKILEAFFAAVMYLAAAMTIGKHFKSVKDGMKIAADGIKAVLPAILILAMAYCINAVSKSLGAQQYIISLTENWMPSALLPVITFLTAALISFFTGTAWGTYAIIIPFVLPIALNLSDGSLSTIVLVTVGAIVSGGIFGDHCSPVSDTTCISSFGAGSDHIDHVTTQLPYALVCGVLACIVFIIVSIFVIY